MAVHRSDKPSISHFFLSFYAMPSKCDHDRSILPRRPSKGTIDCALEPFDSDIVPFLRSLSHLPWFQAQGHPYDWYEGASHGKAVSIIKCLDSDAHRRNLHPNFLNWNIAGSGHAEVPHTRTQSQQSVTRSSQAELTMAWAKSNITAVKRRDFAFRIFVPPHDALPLSHEPWETSSSHWALILDPALHFHSFALLPFCNTLLYICYTCVGCIFPIHCTIIRCLRFTVAMSLQ